MPKESKCDGTRFAGSFTAELKLLIHRSRLIKDTVKNLFRVSLIIILSNGQGRQVGIHDIWTSWIVQEFYASSSDCDCLPARIRLLLLERPLQKQVWGLFFLVATLTGDVLQKPRSCQIPDNRLPVVYFTSGTRVGWHYGCVLQLSPSISNPPVSFKEK